MGGSRRGAHVELGAALRASTVQGDELSAQELLAWCDARWDCDGLDAFVCDLNGALVLW